MISFPELSESEEKLNSQIKRSTRIVVVGGGIAGLEVASQLAKQSASLGIHVTLIDADSSHVWKPMLHTIAAGTSNVHHQQIPFAEQARFAGFQYVIGEVTGVNREFRTVEVASLQLPDGRVLTPKRLIPFDVLILAVGSQANNFGTPGATEHCYTIDSRVQANNFNDEVRNRLLQSLYSKEIIQIGIVGGGATGVELAAELVQLAESAAAYGADDLKDLIKITIIENADRLLSAFPENVALATQSNLEKLGVSIRTGVRVVEVGSDGFKLSTGEIISANFKIWAAGVKGPEFLNAISGLEVSRNHQLIVNAKLQTTEDACIFALGDCASLTLSNLDHPLPPTAQVAHQQAKHLIKYLPSWLEGNEIPDFRYSNMGMLVSLGEYGAYGSLGQFGIFKGGMIKGLLAQLGHVLLYRSHQSRVHGFWRGTLVWISDLLVAKIRPKIRLD